MAEFFPHGENLQKSIAKCSEMISISQFLFHIEIICRNLSGWHAFLIRRATRGKIRNTKLEYQVILVFKITPLHAFADFDFLGPRGGGRWEEHKLHTRRS